MTTRANAFDRVCCRIVAKPQIAFWLTVALNSCRGPGPKSIGTIGCCHFCETLKGTNYAANSGPPGADRHQTASEIVCESACGIVRHFDIVGRYAASGITPRHNASSSPQ
jgi:hypothetical protein